MINFDKFERIAFDLIEHRKNQRCFHVAGIYDKYDRLISVGFNQLKTHGAIKKYNYYNRASLHAELSASLRGGQDNYKKHTMLVLRYNMNDVLDYSRPCAGCLDLLRKVGIDTVFYTDKFGRWVRINPFEIIAQNKPDRYPIAV
jgi:hypothetical protein